MDAAFAIALTFIESNLVAMDDEDSS